jgi:hypothetical protein
MQPPRRVAGYSGLAKFIASDKVFCIFRRFDKVSVRILLNLQDEISELEEQLETLDQTDEQSRSATALFSLHTRRQDGNEARKLLLQSLSDKVYAYRKYRHKSQPLNLANAAKKRGYTRTLDACRWRRRGICISKV